MNPIRFALRHPVTVVVAMVALLGAGGLAYSRMKADIFPSLNLPVIYISQPYGGMDPAQMEGLIANYYEYHILYVNSLRQVESKNVQGVSLIKMTFHPGTNMAEAMAEVVSAANRSRAFMPPGTVPPFIMRFDTGSVPVGYLVLSSETKTVGQIQDQALNKVRPMFASIPGVSAPPPFGASARSIVVRADPDRMKAYNLSPDDVIRALSSGNAVSPSGSIRTGDAMPLVPVNSMAVRPQDMGAIAIKPGVHLRDVAPVIEDANDIATGYALVNGKRAVYISATKRAEASTLSVIEAIKANLSRMQAVLPDDIKVSFEFDQSPYVTNSMHGVFAEALLGAALTGLVVLIFLRDWRSAIVVVVNIPLALIASFVALSACGHTVNLMTLGGLAMAVGILVDESTVEVENIHTQMERTPSVAEAVRAGNAETAVPRLLAMLCVLAVFIPSFFMQDPARALFVPLSLAVGFSMIASYVLSSTLVPVLCVWLLKPKNGHGERPPSIAGRAFGGLVGGTARLRWLVVPAYFVLAGLLAVGAGQSLGTEIFPATDEGQFQFRLRGPAGMRIEQTEAVAVEALEFIKREAGPENVEISLGFVGVVPPSNPVNDIYLWTGGPEEGLVRVSLKPGAVGVEDLKRRLRDKMLPHLREWVARKWLAEGIASERVAKRSAELRLSFEPADIVNEVMSFGSPTPVEVVVSGPSLADNRLFAEKIRDKLAGVESLRDLQFVQAMDYPTVEVTIDRERAGMSGVTAEDVARSLVAATSSSRFVVPNFWRDPANGVGYQVQVEVPQRLMTSTADVEAVPIKNVQGSQLRLLRDVADVREGTMPGELDRFNMRRLASLTANIDGEDLGRVAARVRQAVRDAGEPPQRVEVDVRGQIRPLEEMFASLTFGLGIAVAVIGLLLTAYFQSVRLALVAVASVPAVLAGVTIALLLTGTSLNLQSFMGAIMSVGVSVANAILLVTFAERTRREGASAREAAVDAARRRARPILMTSIAMVAGMVPMALGLGESGDQTAPLGRAVIGGLLASTAATLLVLPSVFALVMGRAGRASASLDPSDPDSRHFRPPALDTPHESHP